MSLISWLEGIGTSFAHIFETHEVALQAVATDLQAGAKAAAAIATASGETQAVPILNGIADGAGKINDAVAAGAAAHTLIDGVAAITGLATGLVNSGDIGVKNGATKAAIGSVVLKVGNVAAVVQSAVDNAPAGA